MSSGQKSRPEPTRGAKPAGSSDSRPDICLPRKREKTATFSIRTAMMRPGTSNFSTSSSDRRCFPISLRAAQSWTMVRGPRPVLSGLLKDLGYACDIYDPAFAKTRLWKKRKYSAVLLHEVAEHLKNPSETFNRLAGLVEPGGILAVRTRFPPSGADDLKSWWYRMDPTHVGFFAPRSLSSFFVRNGFSTLRCIEPDIMVFRKSQA